MVLQLIFFYSIYVQAGLQAVPDSFDCSDKDLNSKILAISGYVKEYYAKSDVIEHVDKLEKTLTRCKINPAKYGWGRGIFEFWKRPSYPIRAQVRKDRAACSKPDKIDRASLGDVRDQDSVGWCYAFTAADLLSYKLKQKISAADIAVTHNDGILTRLAKKHLPVDESKFNGGQIDYAIKKIQKKGACLEKNFLSEDNGYGDLASTLQLLSTGIRKNYANICAMFAEKTFRSLNSTQLLDIIKHSANEDLVVNLAEKACEPRININNIKMTTLDLSNVPDELGLINAIDKQLDSNNIIGITYYAGVLKDINADLNSPHASSIIDRRFNEKTKECEYLIRNSHGRSEKGYDPSLEVTEGNIWMPKSILYKSIHGVTYVE